MGPALKLNAIAAVLILACHPRNAWADGSEAPAASVRSVGSRIESALRSASHQARSAAYLSPEAAESWRIQQHLAHVEATLRAKSTPELSLVQRRMRRRNLDLLHDYWVAGVFPRNTRHPGQLRPYFIDDGGRACAVAHLVAETGGQALARQINARFQTAYLPQMAAPELAAWALQSGLSTEELALIQPTYCQCGTSAGEAGDGGANGGEQPYEPVCGSDGLTYWNECAANLCAQLSVAHPGECQSAPLCETCGVGERLPVVSECAESPGEETLVGVCSKTGGENVVPVNVQVAAKWLALQNTGCPEDTHYDTEAWRGVDEQWDCTMGAGAAGAGAAGAAGTADGVAQGGGSGAAGDRGAWTVNGAERPNDPSATRSGCAVPAKRSASSWPALVTLALLASLAGRRCARVPAKSSPGLP